MADTTMDQSVITTTDGVPLKLKLLRTTRNNRLKALGLVLPLFAFVLITFVAPILDMMFRSIDNPIVITHFPKTIAALDAWDDRDIPDEATFAVIVEEMVARKKDRNLGKVANRLNYEIGGMRSLMTKSARKAMKLKQGPYREALVKIDKRWGETRIWATIKRAGERYTLSYYLSALDLRYDTDGSIISRPELQQIYVTLFIRTLWVSMLIAGLCLLLGFPIAYLMAILPTRTSNLLMIMVLLPFWTSLLVRTTSWIVLLQREGVINDLLVFFGIISDENRMQMIYNMTGTVVAMVHILLPFMVLPLFSVMKTIPPTYMRAAQSLGANPVVSFWRIYFPQTVPGIGAGSILVFILAIGYYITPALVGGRTGQLISNFIAYHMQSSLNWGLAAALGGLLLGGVLALYWVYNYVVGIDNMKLG